MLKKASRTNQIAAPIAVRLVRPAVLQAAAIAAAAVAVSAAVSARCSARHAAAAEVRPKCRSNRAATSRFTAAIASKSSARTKSTDRRTSPANAGLFFYCLANFRILRPVIHEACWVEEPDVVEAHALEDEIGNDFSDNAAELETVA